MMRRRDLLAGSMLAALIARQGRAEATPRYPDPAGVAGAPFADPNFKLVVLSGLLDQGVIDLGTPMQLASHVLGRPFDYEVEGYDPVPAARDYLERYPLTPEILSQAKTVALDGGNVIYPYIWYFWDGEDESFDVTSFAGIKNCANLETIEVISMIATVDLQSLVPLQFLKDVSVGVDVTNVSALIDMPALRSVRILDNRIFDEVTTLGHPTRKVMERLKQRGVKVFVHWTSRVGDAPPAYE